VTPQRQRRLRERRHPIRQATERPGIFSKREKMLAQAVCSAPIFAMRLF
jgi:hypothetical protein